MTRGPPTGCVSNVVVRKKERPKVDTRLVMIRDRPLSLPSSSCSGSQEQELPIDTVESLSFCG